MAQTQYLSNGRSAQAVAGKPVSFARLASYFVFAMSFCFTAAVVVGLVH